MDFFLDESWSEINNNNIIAQLIITANHEGTMIRITECKYVCTHTGNIWLKTSQDEYLPILKVQLPLEEAADKG